MVYTVMRQDDHGNIFEVDKFTNLPLAEQLKNKLTDSEHKQFYWIDCTERKP